MLLKIKINLYILNITTKIYIDVICGGFFSCFNNKFYVFSHFLFYK